MDTVTYPQAKVHEELNQHWLVAHLDVTENKAVADFFGVVAIPTIFGVTGEGRVLDTLIGFVAPEPFLTALQAMTDSQP